VPRYAPLPIVPIDPRNESELVQAASQRVYDASNQTLNDFSAGNPLAALLEGQAFAQGEFLFWANRLPQSILAEWIGPFLGAQRRLGTPATAQLVATFQPIPQTQVIPAGTPFNSDSTLTNGESYSYITAQDIVIPPNTSESRFPVYSQYVGSQYNAPAFSINSAPGLNITFTSLINPQPAVGGSDVETFQQVQERFFPIIRRKNPVSAEDWGDFFIDLYGEGTLTTVQPNRSSANAYNYVTDYKLPNGQVSFFVLGPDGVELTETQLNIGQNAVNFSLPVETEGHLYPFTLSQVQYNTTFEISATGEYGSDLRNTSLNFRDRLFPIIQPGNVFAADADPSVSDIDSAFNATLTTQERYRNPRIISSRAYNTPPTFDVANATYTNVKPFSVRGTVIQERDLVYLTDPTQVYYNVTQNFTPYSGDKSAQTVYGNLTLQQIKLLVPGNFFQGDIVYWSQNNGGDNQLHVVLENTPVNSDLDVPALISVGVISQAKTYSAWTVGNSYQQTTSTGIYDPEIVEYDYIPGDGQFIPESVLPVNQRPGTFAWLVNDNFTLGQSTNTLRAAAEAGVLGGSIIPQVLTPGTSYAAGTWVYTPQVGSGPDPVADPYYNYVDLTKGVVNKYGYVLTSFVYEPSINQTISSYYDSLVIQGILQDITAWNADEGLPIYSYSPRFPMGTYLEYRTDAKEESNYYIAAKYFTPTSTNAQDLVDQRLIYPLYINETQKIQFFRELGSGLEGRVLDLYISAPGTGYVNGTYAGVPMIGGSGLGLTTQITVLAGAVTQVVIDNPGEGYRIGDAVSASNISIGNSVLGEGFSCVISLISPPEGRVIKETTRMFTFFRGDRTFFRQGSLVFSYTATTSVTPLFAFNIYLENGIFVPSSDIAVDYFDSSDFIPYFNPAYIRYAEDTVISEDGRNFYRVMLAFTPPSEVVNWSGTVVENTARLEEYAGNLLRYVNVYICEEPIYSQLGRDISAIKLGNAQITLIPQNKGRFVDSSEQAVFVWENTASFEEVPQLSWFSGTTYPYNPPDYKDGTLAL
jgi:hypothetical protein